MLRHQVQAIIAPVRDLAILGGYGSGKSTAGMLRLKRHCALNGVDRRRKGSTLKTPKCAIVAPTFKVLDGATRDTFDAVFPAEWIRRRKGTPRPYVELVNGVVIELHSGPTLEGSNYFAILVEEIQHRAYTEKQWSNFSARPRDANAPTLTETYTGLPEEGRVRGRFDREPRARAADGSHGGHWTILCATRQNTQLPREVLAAILASVPSSEGAKLIEGKWMTPSGAVFATYDSARHVTEFARGDPSAVTHLAIDPGPLAAVMFGQLHPISAPLPVGLQREGLGRTYQDVGLRVVGQLLPENEGVEGICEQIRRRSPAWRIVPGESKIFIDPSASVSIDDKRTIKRFFPGVSVIEADGSAGSSEERAKLISRGLQDSVGTVRLTFSPALRNASRGALETLTGTVRSPVTGDIKAESWLEHARDALGYLVEGLLPPPYQHAGLPTHRRANLGRR